MCGSFFYWSARHVVCDFVPPMRQVRKTRKNTSQGEQTSKTVVYSALAADLAIAITKFIAAAVTNSSAMVSEGVHSLIDSMNQVLLLVGLARSKKPPDEDRPFGYGKELYFWSFVVSVLLFSMGGSVSFYEGLHQIQHPVPLKDVRWSYVVLGASFLFNVVSLLPPIKAFNKERGNNPFWKSIMRSKDPTTFMVLLEDASGLIGIIIAFAGIVLGHLYSNTVFDAVASLIIGTMLMGISVLLAIECRSLLIGEAASRNTLHDVVQITESDGAVIKVIRHFSMYLAPEEIVLQLIARFEPDLTTLQITEAIQRIQEKIRSKFPRIRQIYIEPAA
jgi:cation diffusion facilitator family transporter